MNTSQKAPPMVTIMPESRDTLLASQMSGNLSEENSKRYDHELHRRKAFSGASHMVLILNKFDGCESLGTLWTNLKANVAQEDDFQKIAIARNSTWDLCLEDKSGLEWLRADSLSAAINWVAEL